MMSPELIRTACVPMPLQIVIDVLVVRRERQRQRRAVPYRDSASSLRQSRHEAA
jgi:hypothetical protein